MNPLSGRVPAISESPEMGLAAASRGFPYRGSRWGLRDGSFKSEGKIFVAKNGSFLEKEFLTKEVTGRKVELDEVDEPSLIDQSSAVPEEIPVQPAPIGEEANDEDHETSNEEATEPRRSTRERTTPDWYDPCLNVMIVDNNDEDPATYEEAMMSPDSNKWQEAMKSEMGSMYDNKVWTLVDLPDSRKAVENKWIFKRKTDVDGNITVYKARLVAKGFRQIQGVDYDETFSPIAKLKSVRILLAIAAFFDYEIWQMDVKTAFLNGDIEEELYMVQPKGFVDPKNANKGNGRGAAGLRSAGSRQRPAEEQPAGAVAGCLGSRLALSPSRPGCGLRRCSWAGFYKPYPTGVYTSDRLEAGEPCTGRNWVGEPGSKVHADLISRKVRGTVEQQCHAPTGHHGVRRAVRATEHDDDNDSTSTPLTWAGGWDVPLRSTAPWRQRLGKGREPKPAHAGH
ncbi:hypothetical protein QYE76_063307 [Lolium multiflorum]|uniref:Reverse transcriptase Ty1/copia-type domain-containing protein n=1 Tax=Lolium multiflorum TaxID=4521 RepID=A0AAD8S4R2_LOLMU|nr:hypothetical protein QYE76_063307 [Lolium multiflorum]